jgi:hypothetical protein
LISPEEAESEKDNVRIAIYTAWGLASTGFLAQMLTNGRYGYFRDELYFLAASDHLAAGYVDFAPLIAWLARGSRAILGESLHAIRLLPALAFAAEIALTGFLTLELGGKKCAVLIACVCVLIAPVILGNATRLSMNPLEPLFWMGCVYFLLRAVNEEKPEHLLWCGILLGIGLENKHSTIFFLTALVLGLLCVSERKLLATKWFWLAAAVAVALALPNVLWQYAHHFPTIEDLRNVKATHKNIELPPLAFLKQQIMMLNPATSLVWVPGFFLLLFRCEARRYRSLSIAYIFFLAVMMALKGKDYYLAAIYPMLFAAGGVFWETNGTQFRSLRWTRVAVPALVLLMGIVSAPLVLPILPPEKIVSYMRALGLQVTRTETNMTGELPQHFADEFGWEEMVRKVATVYNAMAPEERAKTAILSGNYGGAGAIDFFGAKYGLPEAISAHQNYYYWGYRGYTGERIIMLEWSHENAAKWCENVDDGPVNAPAYGMGWEHYTILTCHQLKKPMEQAWERWRVWN